MTTPATQLVESQEVSAKVVQLLKARTKLAVERYGARVKDAFEVASGAAKKSVAERSVRMRPPLAAWVRMLLSTCVPKDWPPE